MPERKTIFRILGLILGLGLFTWVSLNLLEESQATEWPPLPLAEIFKAGLLVLIAHGLHGLAWAVGARQYATRL